MRSVPKIVTDRLRTAPPALNHPDADVLTAFSERSLPDAERATVVEHLARCGDCRDIVALALPDAEPGQQVLRPMPSGWFTWPVLRWGVVAVGIVAIASFGLGRYRRQTSPSTMTSSSSPAAVAKVAQNEAPSLPIAGLAPESAKERDMVKAPSVGLTGDKEGKTKGPAAPAEFDHLDQSGRLQSPEQHTQTVGGIGSGRGISSGTAMGGPIAHGPKVQYQNSNSFQYNNAQNKVAPAASAPYAKQAPNAFFAANTPAPSPAPPVEVQSQNVQVGTQGQNQQALQLETKSMALQPTEGGQGHTVERAKEPGLALSSNNKTLAGVAPPAPSGLSLRAPDASWTISSGALQRSFDQGKTWHTVDVNSAPGFAYGGNLAVETASARTADLKKEQAAKEAALAPVFRAVAANGADVWAGGGSGLLYHSIDSGAHWTRVKPFAGSAILTGDILRLDFSDVLHGRILTSAPEVWLTADGGQTWQKQ
jgi:cytoskeletal protein RodZ